MSYTRRPKKTRSGIIKENVERRYDLTRPYQSGLFKDINKLAIKVRKQRKKDELFSIENEILRAIVETEIDARVNVKEAFLEDLHSGDLMHELEVCSLEMGLPQCLKIQLDTLVKRERKRRERKISAQ